MKRKGRKKCIGLPLRALLTGALTLALLAGVTAAWVAASEHRVATLMGVQPPENIDIWEPDRDEPLRLDLHYTDADKTGDAVTVKRLFRVHNRDAGGYRLEIAHTTNLEKLDFRLYAASRAAAGAAGTVTDKGVTCAYGDEIPLTALNRAAGTGDYYHATEKYHSLNYGEYARVQEHAEPLYRISQEITAPPDYFILEITWTEVDEKETDLIYLLATQA